MVYKTFLKRIQSAVADRLGSSFSVSLQTIPKNNGELMDSLCIRKLPSPVAAAIYLQHFYQCYEEGMTIPAITSEILSLYTGHPFPSGFHLDDFLSADGLEDRLACKLIHTEKNQSLLPSLPHIPFLDLSIVFYLFLEASDEVLTSLVTNEQLALWKLTPKELFSIAHGNTMRLFPPVLKELSDAVQDLYQDCLPFSFEKGEGFHLPSPCHPDSLLYVLTNRFGVNGAYSILYPGVLESFSKAAGADLIIIPSSIHEVLLTPNIPELNYPDMDEMVREINLHEVPAEERLSDHIYCYSRQSGRLFLPSGISSLLPV